MFSDKRLKERSLSVEFTGFMAPSPVTAATHSVVAETPAEEPENHSTNQKLRNWRRAMFKRAFTIDVGLGTHVEKEADMETDRQKERKDTKRISFQRPPGTMEYNVAPNDTLNSIALRFNTTPNELVTLNKLFSRSVVPGKVLFVPDPEYVSAAPPSPPSSEPEPDLVKPHLHLTRVASSPHPRLSRVVQSCSEEDEVPTEKFLKVDCKFITDGKGTVGGVLLVTPSFLMFDPDRSDRLVQEAGCEEFGVMCSLEEVMSACVCTEVTDPQLRLQLPSNLDLPTVGAEPSPLRSVSHGNDSASLAQCCSESKQTHARDLTESVGEGSEGSGSASPPPTEPDPRSGCRDDPSEMEELRRLWKSHAAPSANEEHAEQEAGSEAVQCVTPEQTGGASDVRFLCICVLKPMRKTFVSLARASMQQYALRERKKHQYWFCVPRQRSHHILLFFLGEGEGRGSGHSFLVVKSKGGAEPGSDQPPVADLSTKDWEVVSAAEYQRRVDALKSEDLRSLCRRLQISTVEEMRLSSGRAEVEAEPFRPTLNQTSNLLTQEHVHMLAKHLPPRTIGYPWSLAFSTATHGISINTLYRTMRTLETPVLLVLRDTEGQVFGALASEPLKVTDSFYGTGETFLFTFCPEFEVFKWTGDNMFFLKGDMDSLTFGGGGGESGLWLDGDLYHGRSNPCKTFGNPCLSKKEDFFLQDIEVWSFQ